MYTLSPHDPTTSDLAARLTDVALEALAGTTGPLDSVEMELALWHTLEAELERDRRWQRFLPRRSEFASLGRALQEVVSRASRQVAAPHADRSLCPA